MNHTYEQKKKMLPHQMNHKNLDSNEILSILLNFHPNLENIMNQEIDSYINHLNNEEKRD